MAADGRRLLRRAFRGLALNAESYMKEPNERLRNLLKYVRTQEVSPGDGLVERIDESVRHVNSDKEWVAMAIHLPTIEEDAQWRGELKGKRIGMEQGLRQGKAEGKAEGRAEGRAEGEASYAQLAAKLVAAGRSDDLVKAAEDDAYRANLLKEFAIA